MVGDTVPSMLLVMGVTGAGKSHFINSLSGQDLTKTSDSLISCTVKVQGVPAKVGNTPVLLVDTPGFDDTYRSDAEILKEISEALFASYLAGFELRGVIFLHNITNNKYTHSSMKTLSIFSKICGEDALKNVVLTTTHWDQVDKSDGARRESELSTKIWHNMLLCGAKMARYYGDSGSAVGIASQLLSKGSVVLDLQRELQDGKQLKQTAAGALIDKNVEMLKAEYQEELRRMEDTRQMLLNNSRAVEEQIRQEWQTERARLQTLQEKASRQRTVLEQHPADEVGQVVRKRKSKFHVSKFIPYLGPIIGLAFDIAGMFIGIPVGGSTLMSLF